MKQDKNIDDVFYGNKDKTVLLSTTSDYDIYAIQENIGDEVPPHFHRDWDESWIIYKGSYKIIIENIEITAKVGDVITVDREDVHSVTALEDGSQRIAIFKKGTSSIFKIGENNED